MTQDREDWKERLEETSDGSATFTLKHDPVPWGERYCVQRVAVQDEDSDFTELRIVVVRAAYDHVLEQQLSPVAATWYWMEDPVWLIPGEYLAVRMDGTTSGDKVKAHITGYKEEWK